MPSFVKAAKATMKYSLDQCKDDDHDQILMIFENYQRIIISGVLASWKNKQQRSSLSRWLDADRELKLVLLNKRARLLLADPSKPPPQPLETLEPPPTTVTTTTNNIIDRTTTENLKDVIDWLKLNFSETLAMAELSTIKEYDALEHLATHVGPIRNIASGSRIFSDSDTPTSLGMWLVVSGDVVLSVDTKDPSKDIKLEQGGLFTSKILTFQSEQFACAANDEDFACFAGSGARSGKDGACVLHFSRLAYLKSIGKLMVRRKERSSRKVVIKAFIQILMGKKYNAQEAAEHLAGISSVERLPRKATVTHRPLHFAVLQEGTLTVSKKDSGKTQIAVINEIGSIVHCRAEEANTNKKRARKAFTEFEQIVKVNSSKCIIVWIPLNGLDSTIGGTSLRSKLVKITEAQAVQRQNRTNNSIGTLQNVDNAETERRRKRAADILTEAEGKATDLSKHVAEFMDWKKGLDEEMNFSDLKLSPARPSLSVTSPNKSRFSWSHQQRDFDAPPKPSKYAYSNRKTVN